MEAPRSHDEGHEARQSNLVPSMTKSVLVLYLYCANDCVFGKSVSVKPCWKALVMLFQLQARVWEKL